MKIRTLIVDDEPCAIEVIDSYLKHFKEIDLVGKCNTAIQAFQLLQKTDVDLVFLDIKMPGLLGTDFIKSLKNPPKIIFTTAYQDYALQAFELNAVDYLLKPIPFDRFLKALEKVFDVFKIGQHVSPAVAQEPVKVPNETVLYLRIDRKMVKVKVDEIYWVESAKDYIKVFLKDKTLVSKQKISVVEDLLPEDRFIRIHRSFIVATDKIESYHSYSIGILGKELPIGRNYKVESQRRLKEMY